MRKAVVLSAAIPALLAVSVLGAAAWSGRVVTGKLAQQTRELSEALPFIVVEEQRIEHGLFSSTRSLTLKLGCVPALPRDPAIAAGKDSLQPIRLAWRDVVHHAPLPSGQLGLASIDSQLIAPAAYRAQIERVTGSKPLLTVHTAIDLRGASTSDLTVPPLRYEQPGVGSIAVTSMQVRIEGKATADASLASKYMTTTPGVALSTRSADGSAMTVRLGAVSSETVLEPHVDRALWLRPARSTSQIRSLELVGSAPAGAPIEAVRASFDDLRMQLVSTLKEGLFSSTSSMVGRGRINEVAIDKLELRTSLRNIHAASYQQLVRMLLERLLRCDAGADRDDLATLLPQAEQTLASLLLHDPEYALDSLTVELGGKRAELSYSVGTRGVSTRDVSLPLPAVLFSKGVLRGSLKVHPALVAQALAASGMADLATASAGLSPSAGGRAADARAGTSAALETMIEQLVARGYLEREGELIKASASFEGGQVLLNGKALALPDLSSLSGP